MVCPACGSRRIRHSRPRGIFELLARVFGREAVRCRDCKKRFTRDLVGWSEWRYARCPRCYRMDLNGWSEQHYQVPLSIRIRLCLGARRYRCEACRCNFASFRRLKQRFRFHAKSAGTEWNSSVG